MSDAGAGPPNACADLHIHSEWSWDTYRGSMEGTCARAIALGLPAVAFTDHADFTDQVALAGAQLDMRGYQRSLERCREQFHDQLVVLSGVELGEPHRFPGEAGEILAHDDLDRVLGSVHCVPVDGKLVDASALRKLGTERADWFMRCYLDETLALVESDVSFDVLTHLDYPKRYWPDEQLAYDERNYEPQFRAVLDAAARRGVALEVNTARWRDPAVGLCPGPTVLQWWCDAGGSQVSLGSDAHAPEGVAQGFACARRVIEEHGFRPPDRPSGHWTRGRMA